MNPSCSILLVQRTRGALSSDWALTDVRDRPQLGGWTCDGAEGVYYHVRHLECGMSVTAMFMCLFRKRLQRPAPALASVIHSTFPAFGKQLFLLPGSLLASLRLSWRYGRRRAKPRGEERLLSVSDCLHTAGSTRLSLFITCFSIHPSYPPTYLPTYLPTFSMFPLL